MNVKPIVKWAGGKRQLINNIIELVPKTYNRYFEPFIGGGALLFALTPSEATINDANSELLAIYRCLADNDCYNLMIESLNFHEDNHNEDYYYRLREQDREPNFKLTSLWERASRTIYLNKSCFNGLYRVNSKGFFNVPSGKKKKVQTYDRDNIIKLHNYFITQKVTILEGDFSIAVKDAKKGDFVYFDPPYDPFDEKDSFTSYTKFNFSKEDQIRLANLSKELSRKGVYVMLSNHNTKLINELYEGFNIHIVKAKRIINSDSKGRGSVEEVIITNY